MCTDSRLYPEEIIQRVKKGMGCNSRIGTGWFGLVEQLDSDIAKLAPDYTIDQIKEKFGSLRFYIGSIDENVFEEVYELIRAAEKKSSEMCDVCGRPAKISTYNYLVATRCKIHEPT